MGNPRRSEPSPDPDRNLEPANGPRSGASVVQAKATRGGRSCCLSRLSRRIVLAVRRYSGQSRARTALPGGSARAIPGVIARVGSMSCRRRRPTEATGVAWSGSQEWEDPTDAAPRRSLARSDSAATGKCRPERRQAERTGATEHLVRLRRADSGADLSGPFATDLPVGAEIRGSMCRPDRAGGDAPAWPARRIGRAEGR